MSARDQPDPDDPVEYYLDVKRRSGIEQQTEGNYRNAFSNFKQYLLEPEDLEFGDVTDLDCLDWITTLREEGYSDKSIEVWSSMVNQFYAHMSDRGSYETNPMAVALDQVSFDTGGEVHRREISVSEMRESLKTLMRPAHLLIVLLFAKTGIRLGELVNLDMRDLHIDHPEIKAEWPTRTVLERRPNTLFVSSEISEGDEHNGEVRRVGNKRERPTIIPLDDELVTAFVAYLNTRPSAASPAQPLFVGVGDEAQAGRATPKTVRRIVRRHASDHGWYDPADSLQSNVTPHYYRHFFTTHGRDSLSDEKVVEYVRGDVGDKMMDRYTHNWGSNVGETYRRDIFKLL